MAINVLHLCLWTNEHCTLVVINNIYKKVTLSINCLPETPLTAGLNSPLIVNFGRLITSPGDNNIALYSFPKADILLWSIWSTCWPWSEFCSPLRVFRTCVLSLRAPVKIIKSAFWFVNSVIINNNYCEFGYEFLGKQLNMICLEICYLYTDQLV